MAHTGAVTPKKQNNRNFNQHGIISSCGLISTHYNYIYILIHVILRMAT